MKQSENVNELIEALAKAKLSFTKAKKSGKNNAFSKVGTPGTPYSTIDDILEVCNVPLANNGLVVIQDPEFIEGRLVLTTRIYHKSGQWIEEDALSFKPAQDTAQSIAGAITYSKRYALIAMLGISCGEEDDDGNAASGTNDPKSPPKSPPKMPPQNVLTIMQKYIAKYGVDKELKKEWLTDIFNRYKFQRPLDVAEEKIRSEFEEFFGDQGTERKTA